jgi:SET domain-containing protein
MADGPIQVDPATPTARFAVLASPIEGRGAFALRRFEAGDRIVQYDGERISKTESLRRCEGGNCFIFALDAEWDLDGDQPDNPARFVNHSCDPNCEARLDKGAIWLIARRNIRPGEELTFDYGYDLTEYRQHRCHCGGPGCCGFIVAEHLRDQLSHEESLTPPMATSRSRLGDKSPP